MKKKRIRGSSDSFVKLPKIYRIMKLLCLFMFVALVQVSASSYAQSTKLNISGNNLTLEEVFGKIEDQSEFSFIYNLKQIDLSKKVDVDFKNEQVDKIMDQVLEGTNITYTVNNRLIVVHRDGEASALLSAVDQQQSVTGKVTDEQGLPLPGVTVVIKGTTKGTVTNMDGNYSITNILDGATLQFSFVGMLTQEIAVGNQTTINIILTADAIGIEEVIAIGYGTMRKADITGSVERVDLRSFENQPNTSIVQSLQGTTPGLNVGTVTRPGENPSISIRGRNSLSGSTSPLIVLDGVIYRGNLVELSQNDIESVDILKDASSKAIYGSQAANGVMIITSKKGKQEQKPVFNFSSYYAVQTPSNALTPLSRDEFIQKYHDFYYEEAYLAPDYTQPNPDFDVTTKFLHMETIDGYANGTDTDWLGMSTQNGSIFNTDLSMAGRTKKLSYYLSGGYTKQEGYAVNDKYDKINLRANFDNAVTDWMTLGMQTFITSADYSGVAAAFGNANYLHAMAASTDENGEMIEVPLSTIDHPLVNTLTDNYDKRLNLFGNFFAKITVPGVKGLTYKINYSTNYRTRRNYNFNPIVNNGVGVGSKYNSMTMDQSIDNVVNYRRTFLEKHAVDLTLLYGYEEREGETTEAGASNYLNQALGYNKLEAGEVETRKTNSGAWDEYSLYQMARLNYKFNDKYLATFTVRRDGFSGFGSNEKFGVFPSVALAWVASDEQFIKEALPWMNVLKLRTSYGASGNRTVGRFATLAKVGSGYQYIFGNQPAYAQWITSMANNNLGWETTTGVNLGLDFSVLNNRINGTVDYYHSKTTDILYNVNIPRLTGFSSIATNIGEVANNGIELTLSTVNVKNRDFMWDSRIVFSKNNNKIVSILGRDDDGDGVEDDLVASGLFIGEPLGTIYNYNVIGIYQIGDDIPDGYKPGHFIIEDLNDDGIITADDDRKIIGTTNPAYRIGFQNSFSYKNWSLTLFINSIQGGKDDYLSGQRPNENGWWRPQNLADISTVKEFDYWTPSNPNAMFSNPRYRDPKRPVIYQSRSFVRLQDLNLTYKLPKSIINNVFQDANVFFSAKNLLTITDWVGVDPESGAAISTGASPVMKSYSFGFNLKF